jgi:hypothetical protein
MMKTRRVRNLLFILAGVFVLVFKPQYSGPMEDLVYAYASNISVSFGVYFILLLGLEQLPLTRLLAVIGALLAVELFELTNGFGLMSNTYDPMDYFANALGISLALVVDLLLDRPDLEKQDRTDRTETMEESSE